MAAPVFEEFEPASGCDCPGCLHWRRVAPHSLPVRLGGHPAAHGARRALVLAAAAGTMLGASQPVAAVAADLRPERPGAPAADEPDTPQGSRAPLYGGNRPKGEREPAAAATTRAEIINRAKQWVAAKVPYSMAKFWADGYRQDCSGFVSMAWNLGTNEWTGSLGGYAVRIGKEQLQPGDILLFHNPADPVKGSHVTVFGGWTDYTHTQYIAYEQVRPNTRRKSTPYAYWSHSGSYVPYRYKGLKTETGGGSGGSAATPFPGASYFGPGANNKYVTKLGQMLVARGGGRFYTSGPGPRWTEADRRATQAFQLAQGWKGSGADGIPGPRTWDYLVNGKGRDIPRAAGSGGTPGKGGSGTGTGGNGTGGTGTGAGSKVPAFPGKAYFRPGQSNKYVTELGRQLVKKGFGKYYTKGPGPRWSESDRRNVEAFQRAQGWRDAAADGYPGPETWRRLFS
ncbi:peptidoglycan-binding protein [Streptomyces sp. PSKA54]|uniref:Peptidoglycan-binding protein n=1 Tax=Streptomyces himalayensis subsp. aureolus TaxID=2758039 RepID=A0A7W2CWL8_9ACTN|nr:peptidoglycan-binding protein [Streptomyces himalayensis]MBA4860464.1 peptidoglycan-binding protein [Streptomyces himalayensis subsp. aureolus]